jgi:tRNA pseudouridine38-40 synthase
MRNIKITVAYDGTRYNGWQVQKNGRTVQDEIEGVIRKISGHRHVIYGAGRTDAGVHAMGQVAHFKTALSMPVKRIPNAINAFLPADIAVIKAEEVPLQFHSQYDATEKHYRYYIFNSKNRHPFRENYAWRVGYTIDLELMRAEAEYLIGKHDFKSFQARDRKERNSVRAINSIRIRKARKDIVIDIRGDGFLYNMVRNIAGTLVEIGRGYFPEGSMSDILNCKDRTKAGPTAPAKGLFLMEVKYV